MVANLILTFPRCALSPPPPRRLCRAVPGPRGRCSGCVVSRCAVAVPCRAACGGLPWVCRVFAGVVPHNDI